MKQYTKANIPLAKELRKNMTPWERKLWYDYLRYYPIRFQRQKAIGEYIVDFYCAKARLVLELDGGGHYEPAQMQADAKRTEDLAEMNLHVIRICNLDIDHNFRGVCEYIDMEVQKSLPQSASLTAPSSEGALRRNTKQKIYALGFFDGVHLGHQALLNECVHMAAMQNCTTAAITFERHPQALFTAQPPALITTAADRTALLRHYGVMEVRVLPVTAEVMGKPWKGFLEELVADGAAGFVCGDDFRFGHKGQGDSEKLKNFCQEHDLSCVIVPEQTLDGRRISSSYIRRQLECGDMATAVRFLGHPYLLRGTVMSGRRLGRTIGVPTANLLIPEGIVVPKLGVYACTCRLDGRNYAAVTNIGSRPTVEGHQTRAESWILDFDGDLYGREITLELHKFLRPEQKFASLEELKEQIQYDAAQTRTLLR